MTCLWFFYMRGCQCGRPVVLCTSTVIKPTKVDTPSCCFYLSPFSQLDKRAVAPLTEVGVDLSKRACCYSSSIFIRTLCKMAAEAVSLTPHCVDSLRSEAVAPLRCLWDTLKETQRFGLIQLKGSVSVSVMVCRSHVLHLKRSSLPCVWGLFWERCISMHHLFVGTGLFLFVFYSLFVHFCALSCTKYWI